jgi:hypothetical protein
MAFTSFVFKHIQEDRMAEKKQSNFAAKRYTVEHTVHINADPDAVFALACPVEELKWIRNWSFDMIYSVSGRNENNCIFKEYMSGVFVLNLPDTPTYWHTTRYDKVARRFHALLIYGDLAAGKFEFYVTQNGNDAATVDWRLIFTTLTEAGNHIADESLKERLSGMLNFLAESARHYLETGTIL